MTATHQTVDENVTAILDAHAPLPGVTLTAQTAEGVDAQVLVVATADDEGTVVVREAAVDPAVAMKIQEALQAVGAKGAAEEVLRLPAPEGVNATSVLATGTGKLNPDYTGDEPVDGPDAIETLRAAAAAATRKLAGTESAVLALPATTAEELGAVTHGALLGTYTFTRYRTPTTAPLAAITVASPLNEEEAKAVVERAEVLASAVAGTRDFVNATPIHLTPEVFALAAKELGEKVGCEVEILDDEQLRAGGYGALVGVGQGSIHPPRLARITWDGTSGAAKEIALVGKGITFDSGGLSLKPGKGMETMKCDMAGAATVLHAVLAAAALKLPVKVSAWLTLAENMPSGEAQRPSDVVTALDGTTIEVLNTDAEGRLAMADAMVAARNRAGEEGLDLLVDVATLTGAQMIALGDIAGVMGTKDARERVIAASRTAGEAMWPAPLPVSMRKPFDSPIADMTNMGAREGGMMGAGCFLKHFAGDAPWAHMDIAGPAFHEKAPTGVLAKGGTGVAVATLLALLEASTEG